MQRIASVLFLIIGGWLLMCEPLVAFMNLGKEAQSAELPVLLILLAIAAVPLAIGTALSPGERWRELGLTILLSAAMAVFAGVSTVAVFADPGFQKLKPALPPMPDIGVAPVPGVINLVVVIAIGWFLYRRRSATATA